jgi:hypothetical protein
MQRDAIRETGRKTVMRQTLRRLAQTSAELRVGSCSMRMVPPPPHRKHLPNFMEGGEALVAPVEHATIGPGMLKIYHTVTPERQRRADFLCSLGLHEVHPSLAAAPRLRVVGPLEGSDRDEWVDGHVATRVPGVTFDEALEDEIPWLTRENRIAVARELCVVMMAFEQVGFVHGDIARNNAMIALQADGRPQLRLLDFDGFYHPSVPALPVRADGRGAARGIGQDGYRHAAFDAGPGREPLVTSDRAATSALLLELITLTPRDRSTVLSGCDTLIDPKDARARSVRIPAEIAQRWPIGAQWVEMMFNQCARPEDGPGPADWLSALDSYAGTSGVTVGDEPAPVLRIRLPNGTSFDSTMRSRQGTLERLKLPWVRFERLGTRLFLSGTVPPGWELKVRYGSAERVQSEQTEPEFRFEMTQQVECEVSGGLVLSRV